MDSDVSSVKAEIKAWERQFKAVHERNPTVQDIKRHQQIADKYRLYKKLSKPHPHSRPPSTPPPTHPLPSSVLISKSRTLETTAPLTTFNPFSPQKNKGKQRETTRSPGSKDHIFPLLLQPQPSSSLTTPPSVSSALSRARKRLRGEPVSPSPDKSKRRRVGSQTSLPFKPLPLVLDSSSSDDDHDESNFGSLLISASPVKAPAGFKSFKLLFEDITELAKTEPSKETSVSRTNSIPISRGPFGDKSSTAPRSVEEDRWDVTEVTNNATTKALRFGDSVASQENISTRSSKAKKTVILPVGTHSEIGKSAKRSLSVSESDTPSVSRENLIRGSFLIPPSPPLPDPSRHPIKQSLSNSNGKAKGKPTGRKKAKTIDSHGDLDNPDNETSSGESSKTTVKVINRANLRSRPNGTAIMGREVEDLEELDHILGSYAWRGAPHGQESHLLPGAQLEDKFEVDLPDKLRNILTIESAELKARHYREELLVKGLVSGHRVGHYDPAKGGEIWNIGEDDTKHEGEETWRDTEGEDDWEGEPVPWEVGEL